MNQEPNRFEEESRQAQEATKKLKRRMLIAIGIMVAFVIVAIPLISFLENVSIGDDKPAETVKPSRPLQNPYPPDYDTDILKDPAYLALDRDFHLKESTITTVLDVKNLKKYNPAVILLYDMVNAIIRGDADTYNSFFAESYFEGVDPHGKPNEPEKPFTMQRIYDIYIVKVQVSDKVTEDGQKYTEYLYGLEYKINRNDATFRNDIGHDSSRIQYFRITDRESEQVKIEFWRYE